MCFMLNERNFNRKTLGTDFCDERDTSIQIFDKVLLISFMEEENKLEDNYFMYHIAAASIILACKLHDIRSDISPVNSAIPKNRKMSYLTILSHVVNVCSPI